MHARSIAFGAMLIVAWAGAAASCIAQRATPPAPVPAGKDATSSLGAPVFRASMIYDNGPLAQLEIPQRDGTSEFRYLRVGDTLEWNHAKVLAITLDSLRLSRPAPVEGAPAWMDIPLSYRVDGHAAEPRGGAAESRPATTQSDEDARRLVNLALPADTRPVGGFAGSSDELPRSSDPHNLERLNALGELNEMGSQAAPAIPGLLELLADSTVVRVPDNSEPGFRMARISSAAAAVLEEIGVESLPALRKLLVDAKGNAAAREQAASILDTMHFSEHRRNDGRFKLNPVEDADLEAWEKLVHAPEAALRRSAAHCLAEANDPRSLRWQLQFVQDEDAQVQSEAARGLGRLRSPEAVPLLIARVQNQAALDALTAIGAPAVDPLLGLLAKAGLSEMGNDRPPFAESDRLGLALFEMRDSKACDVLRTHLHDDSPVVRRWAMEVLGSQVADRSELLLDMLSDADAGVRAAAARNLESYCVGDKMPAAVERLKKAAVDDQDPAVQKAAAHAAAALESALQRDAALK